MRRDYRNYLRYAKKHLTLGEEALQRGEDADWLLIPSVILAWSAIESFVNNRCSDLNSLPEDMFGMHERAFLLEKRLSFVDHGARIGSFTLQGNEYHALDDKIFFLLTKTNYGNSSGLKGGRLWGRFEELKKLRNGLVHPRQDRNSELTVEEVRKHIETSKELIIEISKRIWGKTIDL